MERWARVLANLLLLLVCVGGPITALMKMPRSRQWIVTRKSWPRLLIGLVRAIGALIAGLLTVNHVMDFRIAHWIMLPAAVLLLHPYVARMWGVGAERDAERG